MTQDVLASIIWASALCFVTVTICVTVTYYYRNH